MDPIHRIVIERQYLSDMANKLKISPSSPLKRLSKKISRKFNKLSLIPSSKGKIEQERIKLTSFRKVGGYVDFVDLRMPEVYDRSVVIQF
ncbi:hypothetical protein CONCODRAFT_9657 [Conidiobolus coronatus NRRL 28638]|uniref:Uncharacterized protein n=1 Tax=Conidiobolus coronatus (strain ATCC 28846 / CBS 209.66 / NRRL 28638) TaxID=796925 RepID=A0A137NZJ1_CONC2|nr:hypothetical protein CONCODRAFT_9657 [Conidiobolus coronatus NRRL 28638]|eukprot:KXN68152.1 hypothetical protein CONCODRAFT_9657 [Conidiobolus coronatus NRRL 28638]